MSIADSDLHWLNAHYLNFNYRCAAAAPRCEAFTWAMGRGAQCHGSRINTRHQLDKFVHCVIDPQRHCRFRADGGTGFPSPPAHPATSEVQQRPERGTAPEADPGVGTLKIPGTALSAPGTARGPTAHHWLISGCQTDAAPVIHRPD
ncbi:hypothetical protein B0H17DRAFT_1193116 [Mycena rosella]|uniref:Uncharacterized protein n=1 Tax=Mycena rosella TaxID=1033263 RepID=A0AAD7M845_MYCRO|nr:hypothetical protein B0H17DRAFT_1193116 [Mycena rosella]